MKVVYLVTRSDAIGGSHIHVRDMAVGMCERGHDVLVMVGGTGPVSELFKQAGLTVYSLKNLVRDVSPVQDLSAYLELKQVLKEVSPDLVTVHSSKAGFLGRFAASSLGIPVLFTVHGWSFTDGIPLIRRYIFRLLERWAASKSDKIITVSEFDRQLGLNTLLLREDQIITIYNGMYDINPEWKAKHGTKQVDEPVHIVKVARFDMQKDHMSLLDAVSGLRYFHLHFIGDGPQMELVKKRVDELNLSGQVTFYGQSDHVKEILSKADIFVLTSHWEGFPLSTLEAMRAQLPVIVSDVGGASEAVEEGVTGYIVPKGDTQTLNMRIAALIQDGTLRKKMGIAARKRYEDNYTFDIMFRNTLSVYEELLQ